MSRKLQQRISLYAKSFTTCNNIAFSISIMLGGLSPLLLEQTPLGTAFRRVCGLVKIEGSQGWGSWISLRVSSFLLAALRIVDVATARTSYPKLLHAE